MNRALLQVARQRAEAMTDDVGHEVAKELRRLEEVGPGAVAQGDGFARCLRALRLAGDRAQQGRRQWTVVLPVAFIWLTIGFAVEGYVSSNGGETFLEYWADGAPPFGINSFRWVATIEALLLLIGGLSIASRFGRHDPAVAVELGVVESLLVAAGAGEASQGPAINRGVGAVAVAVPGASSLSGDDLARLQAVFDVWGEIEPGVAGFVAALRETPGELQRQVAALTGAVQALEAPVAVVVDAVGQAQRSVDDIAQASARTVDTLVDLGTRGSTVLEEALSDLLRTSRELNKAMGPMVETMMILRNVATQDGRR